MASEMTLPFSSMSVWPHIEWTDRSGHAYRLRSRVYGNGELQFDVEVTYRDGDDDDFCTNLTPRTAAEIRKRLDDYLAFMADKAVTP